MAPLIAHINDVGDPSSRQGLFERVTDMFDLHVAAMVESFLETASRRMTDRRTERGPDGSGGD